MGWEQAGALEPDCEKHRGWVEMAAQRKGMEAAVLCPCELDNHITYHSNWDTFESKKLFQ